MNKETANCAFVKNLVVVQIQDYDHSVTFPSLRYEYASVALSKSDLVLVPTL